MKDIPRLIILDGISGSGKSALKHPILKLSNYRDPVLMRFTPSCWVYMTLYQRGVYNYEVINEALQACMDVHVVWLQVTPEEALRRKIAKGDLSELEDLVRAAKLFEQYFQEVTTLTNVHRVDTMNRTEADVVKEVEQKVYVRTR